MAMSKMTQTQAKAPIQMVTNSTHSEDCFQPTASFHCLSVGLYIYMFVIIYHLCLFRIPSPFHLLPTTNGSLTALTTLPAFSPVSLTEFKEIHHFTSLQQKKCCFLLFVAPHLDEKQPYLHSFVEV